MCVAHLSDFRNTRVFNIVCIYHKTHTPISSCQLHVYPQVSHRRGYCRHHFNPCIRIRSTPFQSSAQCCGHDTDNWPNISLRMARTHVSVSVCSTLFTRAKLSQTLSRTRSHISQNIHPTTTHPYMYPPDNEGLERIAYINRCPTIVQSAFAGRPTCTKDTTFIIYRYNPHFLQ